MSQFAVDPPVAVSYVKRSDLGFSFHAVDWLAGCQGHYPPNIPDSSVAFYVGKLNETALNIAQYANITVRETSTHNQETSPQSFEEGITQADRIADEGHNIVLASAAQALTAAHITAGIYLNEEPVKILGYPRPNTQGHLDDDTWTEELNQLRVGLYQARKHSGNPHKLLDTLNCPEFSTLVGFLAQSSHRRTPVILSDITATAAALVAEQLAPGARWWWLASTVSAWPIHADTLRYLHLDPITHTNDYLPPLHAGLINYPSLCATWAEVTNDPASA